MRSFTNITDKSRLLVMTMCLCLVLILPVSSVHASSAECINTPFNHNNDLKATKCIDYLDDTGTIIESSKYLVCNDNITCDTDPDTGRIQQRCCIEPHIGGYGGNCTDISPLKLNRQNLGSSPLPIVNTETRSCDYDEDAKSPDRAMVFIVPPLEVDNPNAGDPGEPPKILVEQSLVEYFNANSSDPHFYPTTGSSTGGLDIHKESVSVTIYPWLQQPRSIGTQWFYQFDEATTTRKYFVRNRNVVTHPSEDALPYHLSGIKIVGHMPMNPYPNLGISDVKQILSCKIREAINKPIAAALSSVMKSVTTSENIPDIGFLCSEGTPQFENFDSLTFNDKGHIEGFDQSKCYCTDVNAGPANAATLLCTRFVAGIEDATAPWRLLVPVPDNGGAGSQRFMSLLTGAPHVTVSIDDFQNAVRSDIRGFFDGNAEVGVWIKQILRQVSGNPLVNTRDVFNMRFFGTVSPPLDPDLVDVNAFKSNPYVRQYISCLSCAKYGGFPTALGCLPADKVDRFLAEGVLGVGIGIAGALSVFCIIYGAIQFQISEGDASKVQKAQKLITQCILGLLLILFSVFLLRFVGVNLLRIYGLS